MQIVAKRTLRSFWNRNPKAEGPLKSWHSFVRKATWNGPADIKAMFGAKVDFVGDNRAIFDIGGNKYRLVAHISYAPFYRVLIKFVGTHAEYDTIDAETIR